MRTTEKERSQDKEFWRDRLRQFKDNPIQAMGCGFDWEKIDDAHKKIVYPYYQKGVKVLDVGCGMGRTAEWFAAEDYTGFDFMDEFIAIAQGKYPDRKFLILDIKEGLPFQDKEFDICIAVSFKHIFITGAGEKAWERALAELKRVAKKVFLLPYGNNDIEEIKKYTEIYDNK